MTPTLGYAQWDGHLGGVMATLLHFVSGGVREMGFCSVVEMVMYNLMLSGGYLSYGRDFLGQRYATAVTMFYLALRER